MGSQFLNPIRPASRIEGIKPQKSLPTLHLSISKADGKRAFAAHTRFTDRYADRLLSGDRQMSNELAELVRSKLPIST